MSRTTPKASVDGLPKGSSKRKRIDADQNSTSAPKRQATQRSQQVEYDEKLAHMDAAILADRFAQALKRHATHSSTIELDDQYLPSKSFADTSSFVAPRVATNLPSFLEEFAGGKDHLCACDDVASPHTIVITASGIRAADLARELRVFTTDESKIAKLFAKHMKLGANIEFVKKTRIGIGVGTPTRLRELIETNALTASAIKRFVVDGSYVDEKKRTIFDLREIFTPMMEIFNIDHVKDRLAGEGAGLEILVF